MKDDTTRISVELDHGDGAIAGRINDGGREITFRGWLALAAALEGIRSSQPSPEPNDAHSQEVTQ